MRNIIKIATVAAVTAAMVNYHNHVDYGGQAQANTPETAHIEFLENRFESVLPKGKMLAMLNPSQVHCMAQNLFQEAVKNNGMDITLAGYGVLNRVNDARWPDTICGVIKQPHQFSWYKSARKRNMPTPKRYFKIAREIITGVIPDPAPWCNYTNWYNKVLDSKKSSNYKIMQSVNACAIDVEGTPHVYIGYKNV